ncbi:YiiX/YebB-like N1pC/P60 family cysteine hydrolase [Shewanella sp. SM21]|uniref:YiiX/YebB-like N1pC/P60 family cysteine hydrolase n=1 Tax=Shewanella sp. SM21 TaxID=2912793 RepID=UPI0021DADF60|nr:YiiX/YebB-like N1pC/P60 family cysteine hydrolase [Shewanella sp. SM21]MCU8086859.1 hypothetical protein [Shewanella sp. SM21]
MFILDMDKLEVGDIILTREKAVLSKGVRFFSQGEYSHAMLYVSRGSYIHSDNNGVHSGNIQRKLFEKSDDVKVVRITESSYVKNACDYARNRIGTEYSVKDAIKSVLPKRNKVPSNKQFCSRLVAESYKYAGLNLVNDPHFCIPSELDRSPYVKEVLGCVREASGSEILFANSETGLKIQDSATNLILREARRITGKNIQNFQDLSDALLLDGSFDSEIYEIAMNSGYYDLLSKDMAKNPWRYDGETFIARKIPKSVLITQAIDEVKATKELHSRYLKMYQYYTHLCSKSELKYFMRERQLYCDLLSATELNKKSAEYALKALQD